MIQRRSSEQTGRDERTKTDEWSIGKDVQAYLSNRLVVLTLHGLVLSDKVKGNRFQL